MPEAFSFQLFPKPDLPEPWFMWWIATLRTEVPADREIGNTRKQNVRRNRGIWVLL